MTGTPLLIDCDPGVDDAIAIFLALASPELDLQAVTTVAGNRPIEQVTRNARGLLSLAGRSDIPVHQGCHGGLLPRTVRWSSAHGDDGLGGLALPDEGAPVAPGHAVDVLVARIMAAAPGTVTLAAIGPLTNVAMAFAMEPSLPSLLKRLVIMGGSVGAPGNITPMAEFNFMHDPVAAHIVLTSGAPIDLFGLNLTRQVLVSADVLEDFARAGTPCTQAARTMLAAYATRDSAIHDPCVIAMLLAPDLFTSHPARVVVDYRPGPTEGASLVDPTNAEGAPTVNVVDTADAGRVLSLFVERISRLGAR
ncbi:nucleoside hydrolase [Acuticoccus sediminis]|uniref:Nucleoside hydrolase n=1 Tax=Acuticoccus sediminis TaxID=2184697 RepID=A0A8B2NHM3_9HYPH|nr:nucleoside hydrolase [Acuticoccus sediminis]RAH97423.1 nucleoside hydrolase [Acuticoccus sediminis]